MEPDEIQEAILRHPGPFVTVKLVYRKFSSRIRPDTNTVRQEMDKLQDMGLGVRLQVDRSDVFFKVLPTAVVSDDLAKFGLTVEEYTTIFDRVDHGLTDQQILRAEVQHPNQEGFDEYITQASQSSDNSHPTLPHQTLVTAAEVAEPVTDDTDEAN